MVAQTGARPRQLARACVVGALAGMAPDLDVLIRSSSDPLLALEYHRHFTHSLVFIPIGALVCALLLYPLQARAWQLGFWPIYRWSLLGYGSHGLLDACTSYGTQLLWPFSNLRVAWDIISVIDPLFTLPLLALVLLAALRKQVRPVHLALVWGVFYLGLGMYQHERAMQMGHSLASERGHQPLRLEVKPSFANLAVWKVIYETDQHFYVDAVKPGLTGTRVWTGERIAKLDLARDLPWLEASSTQARDVQRFHWFSAGYIAIDQQDPAQIVDIRYSMLPQQIQPLWGIRLSPEAGPGQPAEYFTRRSSGRAALPELLQMLTE
nr:metal-dependent hydrolase [Pseudomaricurvus alcaniphilus]